MAKVRRIAAFVIASGTLAGLAYTAPGHARGRSWKLRAPISKIREPRIVDKTFRLPGRPHPSGKSTVLIEYGGRPAALSFRDALAAGRSKTFAASESRRAFAANRAVQAAALPGLRATGARVLYSTQRVLNATVAVVDTDQIAAIRALPGVRSVKPAPIHRLDNSAGVPFIGANRAWDTTGALGSLGLTGENLTIAVIDTGIDYLHANFGGTADYASQDPTVVTDGVTFPTAKVVYGFDLAGENYDADADDGSEIPVPDSDPTDCNGHGSHVAGSAAGFGVSAGATFAGPYDNLSASTLAGFDIGPGVAPNARLAAFKVFGCEGSTALTVNAIELAVDPNQDGDLSDHFDVINMSLGAPYGSGHDASAVAASNAAAAGVIVVTSAGNEADAHFISGSPGAGTNVIATAAISDDSERTSAVVRGAAVYMAFPAVFAPSSMASGTLEIPDGSPQGCVPADFTGFTSGAIALVDRGTCSFKLKAVNAQAAGAVGVVIDNVTTCGAFGPGDDPAEPTPVTIPTVMVSCQAGAALKASLGPASIDPAQGTNLADTIADFSSRGPRRFDISGRVHLKPDVAAPGVNIVSTQTGYDGSSGTGIESLMISGTSMASPHVAGAMALLRQAHPSWTVAQLKAAIMNTSNHDVAVLDTIAGAIGARLGPARAGAGRVDVPQAVQTPVIAYAADEPGGVSVAFSRDVVGTTASTETREVLVENLGATTASYVASLDTAVDASGITLSVTPERVRVAPGETARLSITARYEPSAMFHDLDPSMADLQTDLPRHWITEESALLVLKSPRGGRPPLGSPRVDLPNLRLPVHVVARPASQLSVANQPVVASGGTGVMTLRGPHVRNITSSETPSGLTESAESVVSLYDLLWQSVNQDSELDQTIDAADIRYVGIASDVPDGGANAYAGFAMWKEWSTPAELAAGVCADIDQDGFDDWCWITAPVDETDVHEVLLIDINGFIFGPAGTAVEWDLINALDSSSDTRVLRSDVLTIPFQTGVGFWETFLTSGADADEAFDFTAFAFHFDDSTQEDESPLLTWTPDPPRFRFNGADRLEATFGGLTPFAKVVSGSALSFEVNPTSPGDPVRALVFHHFNGAGRRAEVVTVNNTDPGIRESAVVRERQGQSRRRGTREPAGR